jgi:hypothetical protein
MLKYFTSSLNFMKRSVIAICMFVFLISFVFADPVLVSDARMSDDFMCSNYLHSSKEYRANATFIHVGIVCPMNAKLNLYEMRESEIFTPFNFIASSYVVNGILTDFDDFEIDTRYYYECYTCKDPATNLKPEIIAQNVKVFEGEQVVLGAGCKDEKTDHITFSYAGWMQEDTYMTSFDDQGIHSVDLECKDDFGGVSKKTVSVTVIDVNRPPQIVSVYNYG